MVKLNSEGEIVADQSLGTSGFDFGQALIETSDGGFLVGGSSKVQSGGNVTCQPYSTDKADAVLFKLDMDLNIEWQKCYGGSYDESITGLLEHENGYLFVAYTTSDDGDVSGLHGPTDEATDNWVVSIDFDGNLLWQNCLGGTLYEFADVLLQMDNGFMVVGQTESQDGDVVGNHSQSEYSNDIWLVKLNGEGDLLWQQCIGGLGNEETRFGAIKKSDTDFVIAGQFNKGPSFDVGCVPFGLYADMPDVWIFEVKDTTTFVTDYEAFPENKLKVYPNPARDYVVFELSQAALNNNTPNKNQPTSDNHNSHGIPHATTKSQAQGFGMTPLGVMTVVIVNVYGQKVAELPLLTEKTVWDTRHSKAGVVYYYRLEIDGKILSGKIVVQ